MITYHCDVCGARMSGNDPGRYVVKVETFAAAAPLEITKEDLQQDHTKQIAETLALLAEQSVDEIEDAVYRAFRYDLCAGCHREFLSQKQPGLQNLS